jgi:pimeloyl-ACP methyl ester carboxylesterase
LTQRQIGIRDYFCWPLKKLRTIQILSWAAGIGVLIFLATTVLFYRFQDRIVFQGTSLPRDYVFKFGQTFEEYFIPTEDGEVLNAVLFRSSGASKGLILYFHGNKDNLQRWGQYAIDFTQLGYDILMTDYRGYGKSTGTPTEEHLYSDAETIMRWSKRNLLHDRVILYGRSLGSAVASQLATLHEPEILFLETPFDEISGAVYAPLKMVTRMFPLKYSFPNKEFLSRVKCRKVLIHGTDDWVVPLSSASNLKPLLSKDDQFVIIEGGGHRNLRDFEAFHKALEQVLN